MHQLALLRAHAENLAEVNEHGVPWADALDPNHAWDWVTKVVTDFSDQTLKHDQAAYYKQHFTDKKREIDSAGHKWSVYLKDGGSHS